MKRVPSAHSLIHCRFAFSCECCLKVMTKHNIVTARIRSMGKVMFSVYLLTEGGGRWSGAKSGGRSGSQVHWGMGGGGGPVWCQSGSKVWWVYPSHRWGGGQYPNIQGYTLPLEFFWNFKKKFKFFFPYGRPLRQGCGQYASCGHGGGLSC